MKKFMPKVFALVLILSLVMTASVTAQTPKPAPITLSDTGITVESVYQTVDLKKAIRTSDGLLSLIVELSDPALVAYTGGTQGLAPTSPASTGGKLESQSPASVAYLAYLDQVQANFRTALARQAPGARFGFSYKAAINGLAVKISDADVNILLKMPGVLRVYPDQIRTATMDASLPLINAATAWAKLGGKSSAGSGVKVAVVDSGLWVKNPMFSGANFSMPLGYPLGYCAEHPGDAKFQCNNKVIAGRYFYDAAVMDSYVNTAEKTDGQSPLGIDGHGTHTAGTSAGNEVIVSAGDIVPVNTTISGVAPGAYLMIYKSLFASADLTSASGTDGMLTAALDAALSDGADVINNSWGGGAGDPRGSIYYNLIHNISAAGTTVVFAAGNSGPDSYTIGCPGCVEDAVTVAASTTNRIISNRVDITGPGAVPANLTNIGSVASGKSFASTQSGNLKYDPGNELGCAPFSAGFFTGKVALIKRGTCTFATKAQYAGNAGAIFVIITNNTGGPPGSMSGLTNAMPPAAMVTRDDGTAMHDWVTANPTATVSIDPTKTRYTNNAFQDIMAGFSSVGPNGDPNVLKPDLTAPGVNILSAYSSYFVSGQPDAFYEFLQGTSMSAPHVTGAAALMVQMHPDWTPAEIKTALTSTAVQTLKAPDGVTPVNPFQMGAGRIDLARASDAAAVFSKPSFANGNCVLTCSWSNTIRNVTASSLTFTADVATASGLKVTVSPSSITLGPGLTGDFTVQADVSAATVGIWSFGSVTWTASGSSYPDAYMPIAVEPGVASDAFVLSKTVDKAVITPGQQLNYTITVRNPNPVATTYYLTDALPDNLAYASLTDPVTSKGTAHFDAGTQTITATIPLNPAEALINPADGNGFVDLALLGVTPRNGSCGSCDDSIINFSLGSSFTYFGSTYNSIGVTTNGYLVVGGGTSAPFGAQNMPDPAAPNNVIAPLWTDLDLAGGTGGGGNLYFSGVTDGFHVWYVAQWSSAQQYGAPGTTYTFQVWVPTIATGGPIFYSYVAPIPTTFRMGIGLENSNGSIGTMRYYFDGVHPATGSLPLLGSPTPDLAVTTFDSATVSYPGVPAMPAALQPDQRIIINLVQATNSEDAVVNEALAISLFKPLQSFLPALMK